MKTDKAQSPYVTRAIVCSRGGYISTQTLAHEIGFLLQSARDLKVSYTQLQTESENMWCAKNNFINLPKRKFSDRLLRTLI